MKILPINVLPCEKLELYGEESLSLEELLAIILKTGTKNNNVFKISKQIMELGSNSNSLRFLQDVTINDLIKIEGIGKSKAIQLKAVGEIAKRINYPILEKQKITSAIDVINLFESELKFEKRELIKVVILNNKNIILKIRNIAIGGTNYSLISPKEILSEAIKINAEKIILIHNHPSGDSTPSENDYKITKKIDEAAKILGITLLDHIIIGDGNYKSIKF